ncbi:MAG: N-terminal phage integrase SAM-like domain-containing protein [Clostridium sp.]|nr:MAG: N-terminal phage integrase SAM-like domain-containing protein [Clostridium sp.]
MKYKEWIEIWLYSYIKPTNKTRTFENYKQMLDNHIITKIGDLDIMEIKPLLLQKFFYRIIKKIGNKLNGSGLSASTVNLIITIVQNSLKNSV